MLVKFTSDDPLFEQIIQLLKYRTGATSKAAKRAIYEFHEIERENEILAAAVDSLESEVFRLRQLLDIQRNTKTRTIMRNFRWFLTIFGHYPTLKSIGHNRLFGG